MNPQVLSEESRTSVQNRSWKTSRENVGKLGSAIVSIPASSSTPQIGYHDNTKARRLTRCSDDGAQTAGQVDLQNDLLSALATNKDLYLTSTLLEQKRCTREAIALHALDHVTKYVVKYYDERTLFPTSYLENVGVYSKITSVFLAQQKLILMHYRKMFRTKASPDPQFSFSYPFVPLH